MANLKSKQVAKRAKVNGVTKRAKAKKPKPACPVVAALEGQALDIKRYSALCKKWRETPAGDLKEDYAGQCRSLRDRISGRWQAISHLHPQSRTGAIYLLLLGYADLSEAHTISDNDLKAARRRRGRQCLENGIWHMRCSPSATEDYYIAEWLMPHPETERDSIHRAWHNGRRADRAGQEGGCVMIADLIAKWRKWDKIAAELEAAGEDSDPATNIQYATWNEIRDTPARAA